MIGILSWIIMGLIIGALAKFAMPGRDPGGCIVTILLGVAGAFVGGFLANLLGMGSFDTFSPVGIALSVVGAIVLLVIYRMLVKR